MFFSGTVHELKCYLKYLRRTRGIRVRSIETAGPGNYRLDTGGEEMKDIHKNDQEIIRIARRSYKGKEFIDIRMFYKDDTGEWKPSPKGVTFKPDQIDEVLKSLSELKSS